MIRVLVSSASGKEKECVREFENVEALWGYMFPNHDRWVVDIWTEDCEYLYEEEFVKFDYMITKGDGYLDGV